MTLSEAVIEGTLTPEGTLELDQKPNLRPGRVQVTLVSLPELPAEDPFWQMLRAIWAGQKTRGHLPRSVAEVEAERRRLGDEWDERMRELERLQEESRRLREQNP